MFNAVTGWVAPGESAATAEGRFDPAVNLPLRKAIRAALVEISEYLDCVMVERNGFESEYQAKESGRRERTKKSLKLD